MEVSSGFVVGQAVMFDDPGVYGFIARQPRPAVVVGFVPSKYYGSYIVVEVEGLNLPKRVVATQLQPVTQTAEVAVAGASAA